MATAKKRRSPKPRGKQAIVKQVHYKRARFVPDNTGGETLANFLDRALARKQPPSKRMERLGESNDSVRVINKCYSDNGMICGRFLDYTEGGAQAVLELDEDAEELRIKTLPPAKKEQYLEGILTFGVKGNHVIFVQSKALRHGHFENHLNWLLGTLASTLPEGVRLFLEDEPARELKRLSNVSSIQLKEAVPSATLILDTEDNPNKGLGPVIAALQQMVPKGKDIFGDKLTPEQALALEDLDIALTITRKRKKGGLSVIDDIAHVLRNVEDIDFQVRARGGVFRSDNLRLSASRRFEVDGTGLLALKDVANIMQQWLADLLAQDRVRG